MRQLWFLCLFALGCGPKAFHYPLDGTLRLDEIQVKGTHNSYHVETTDIPEWEYTHAPLDVQLDKQGVRQLELDLEWTADQTGAGHHFEVYHLPGLDDGTTCQLFTECLRTIKRWSDEYPGHLPIYIQMETKDGFTTDGAEPFFAEMESEILSVFPRQRILTPDELRGSAPTLPAALASGWPTLGKLRGRVFFGIDERGDVRDAYTHGGQNLNGRISFIDSDPTDPFGAITIQNDPVPEAAAIAAALSAHLLVRSRADSDTVQAKANDPTDLNAALAEGATFISTDFPAPVAGTAYVVEIPGGMPARCNPVTATPACTPLALENPAFVGSGG
ncbi:MAG TPA: Ca2+-dependent phosphoinositide-specific phospholipase C [Polyangia bacterium]